MKKGKSILFCTLILVVVCMLCACVSKTAETVKVRDDEIPTLYTVVGERKITGSAKGFKNDKNYANLNYSNGDVTEQDFYDYLEYLSNKDYLLLEVDKTQDPLTVSVGKSSSEEGKVILIAMKYFKNANLEISYQVQTGTVTASQGEAY